MNNNQKSNEYSYFLADEKTREIIADAAHHVHEITMLRFRNRDFRKSDFHVGQFDQEDQRYKIKYFEFEYFNIPRFMKDLPEGWTRGEIEQEELERMPGRIRFTFRAMPDAGTPDHGFILDLEEQFTDLYRKSLLECRFGCGPMPDKDRPAGDYSRAFVRTQTVLGPGVQTGRMSEADDAVWNGFYAQMRHHSDTPSLREPDDIATFRVDKETVYIRIPNDEAGTPRFTMPGWTPVTIEHLLEMDAKEVIKAQKHREAFHRLKHGDKDPAP